MTTGIVFNIQSYSLHDGPGIRTTVFLKGCPLRCVWCSNPESQRPEPEIYFDKSKCIADKGCDRCIGSCQTNAIGNGVLDFERCSGCLACASVCPSKAVSVYGERMTVSDVLDKVERESVFYRHGNGGMTLSGGEPLLQAEFAVALLQEARRRRIHTAIETCGFCNTRDLREAARYLDYIMFDIKMMDDEEHIRYTGSSNRIILENIEMLFKEYPDIPKVIRTPVIPSVNDQKEDIEGIKAFLAQYDNYTYELLAYHRFGQSKYAMLGRAYADLPEKLDEDRLEDLRKR